jgi:hypothetical protein
MEIKASISTPSNPELNKLQGELKRSINRGRITAALYGLEFGLGISYLSVNPEIGFFLILLGALGYLPKNSYNHLSDVQETLRRQISNLNNP